MITINGKKFAKNENELTNSLFQSGGTAVGTYKNTKLKVQLFDHNKNIIGVIVKKENLLAKATKLDNGKTYYSYGNVDIIGEFESYGHGQKEIKNVISFFK